MPVLAFLAATLPQTVPFLYANRLIYVDLAVNGKPNHLFLLDTGANKTALDEGIVKAQNLKTLGTTTVEGTAGTSQVGHLRLAHLALGTRDLRDLDVTVQNLGGLLAPQGRRVEGILGTDFLRHYAFRIDFQKRTLTLDPSPAVKSRFVVPFQMDNGIPRFKGKLNHSVDVEFRLDTGASLFETKDVYLNVPTLAWEILQAADPALKPERHFTGSGIGGEVKLPVARLAHLTLGPLEIPRPYVIVQPRQGYFARPDAAGFVSNNLLEKHSPVTLDFRANQLHTN